jgi:EAL domain-containing protein (putative c-di-GMP-specific phosphodiesterase class I)
MSLGQRTLAYQPKLDIGAQRIHAAEALVRWRHAARGALPPDSFIPALEEKGRIVDSPSTFSNARCAIVAPGLRRVTFSA